MRERGIARLALVLAVFVAAGSARAQRDPPGEEASAWEDTRVEGQTGVALRTTWSARGAGGRRTSTVALAQTGADLRPVSAPVSVHSGPVVLTSLALRQGVALVTMVHGGASPSVRIALVPPAGTRNGPVRVLTAPRPNAAGYRPAYAVACADPDGFAVLWQENSVTAGPREVRTYFARLRPDGTWLRQPAIVQVPWGFGAVAWNGHGYHLALYYDGTAQGQTRLNLVTLSAAGAPEQHPWWASPQEAVGEVQLIQTPAGMTAVYRGGADGTALHSITSSAVGQWGREAPPAASHGTIDASTPYALRLAPSAERGLEVVRRP